MLPDQLADDRVAAASGCDVAANSGKGSLALFAVSASQAAKKWGISFVAIPLFAELGRTRPMPEKKRGQSGRQSGQRRGGTSSLPWRWRRAPSKRETGLAAQNARFDVAINHMSQGLCLFDARQRVVFANRRYAEIYRLEPEQITPGTTLKDILEARLRTGLYDCKDGRIFVRDGIASFGQKVSQVLRLADGRCISVVRLPMPDGGLVSTHEDITEREQLNERLVEQHMQLDAALDNMLQGLAMFDINQKLIICNRQFTEMYALASEQAKPGTTMREILRHGVANGIYRSPDAETFAASWASCFGEIASSGHRRTGDPTRRAVGERQLSTFTSDLSDGRCIAVAVKRMPGGGVVTTHQDITEQRRSEAKMAYMALHDALTGLPNRVLLDERLENALLRCGRGETTAMHVLDLDHFKYVNDTMGHPAGDELLRLAANRLSSLVREMDTVARMGGDEFAVLQVGISRPDDAVALARRIVDSLGRPYEICGQQVTVGTSIGIAIAPADGDSSEEIIRNADLALYRAKGDGRGTYRFFGDRVDRRIHPRREPAWPARLPAASSTSSR